VHGSVRIQPWVIFWCLRSARRASPREEDALQTHASDTAGPVYENLVREHYGGACRYAYHLTRNAADAEDLTQEASLRAHVALARYDPRRSFRRWLERILHNLFTDRLRAARSLPLMPLDGYHASAQGRCSRLDVRVTWGQMSLGASTDAA